MHHDVRKLLLLLNLIAMTVIQLFWDQANTTFNGSCLDIRMAS